ncbi:MAG TPA: ATP-binding cassette domain-containing protein [bacterium]|nr:ATP-binding cassette domain-containing protein [bacterium]
MRAGYPIFDLRDVALGYNDRFVVETGRVEFECGGLYLFTGPNGCGKTTLLRAMNGFIKPLRGKIYFDGKDIFELTDLVPPRRRMTYLAQKPVLFRTTVLGNVMFGLRVRGMRKPEAARAAAAALEKVGLGGMAGRNARTLSGGEAQLTALARALVLEPEVLLLDEPTGNVDVGNTDRIESLIKEACDGSGITIVLSTHNAGFAERLGGTVMRLENGRLIPGV